LQDTFLDAQHLIDCFPQYDVTFSSSSGSISTGSGQYDAAALPAPPYKVTFPADQQQLQSAPGSTKRGADATATTDAAAAAAEPDSAAADGSSSSKPVLLIEHYRPINMGPYPEDKPTGNEVRFTSVQVEAVAAGVQPGLTMVVGPPGTGKTDTAVQILQVRLVGFICTFSAHYLVFICTLSAHLMLGKRVDDSGGAARHWQDRNGSAIPAGEKPSSSVDHIFVICRLALDLLQTGTCISVSYPASYDLAYLIPDP
jgi:hypothetical protein